MLAVTRDDGLYINTEDQWEALAVPNYPLSVSFFSALYLEDGTLALGSIGGGLYLLTLEGEIQHHLTQPTLLNSTLLGVMEDEEGNIWGGLDNGITVINRKSSFRLFVDTFGKIGTVYCSIVVDDIMYIGTNQGLFYKSAKTEGSYNLVPGTTGQVWSLKYLKGKLYAGHDRGTFIVEGTEANQIWDGLGTWTLEKTGSGILQGHYNGLSFIPDSSSNATAHYLDNFDLSVQNMIVENDSIIWMSHFHKGIFKLKISEDYKKIEKQEKYGIAARSEMGPQVFKFEDDIYYSTEDSVYRYDRERNQFTSNNELNSISRDLERISGASVVLEDDSWWTFGVDNLFYVTRDPFEQKLIQRYVPLPLDNRNISNGFENISLVGPDEYLVGSNSGYIEFSLPLKKIPSGALLINSVGTSSTREDIYFRSIDTSQLRLNSDVNNLVFNYSIPNYQALSHTQYSYRLLNYSSAWSKWSQNGTARFENLPSGEYTFEVKGRINEQETEILGYSFFIARPWYYSNLAWLLYALIFLVGILVIHYTYKRRHRKIVEEREKNLRMKNMEAEQEIIRLQKEHLERDMAEKNGQLAASTMSLIKKNEFLSNLKEELKKAETSNVKGVIKTIDQELREEDNWKMFQEAFKNTDKEFFEKIKAKHPELTPNDLRLCAYLRLNLSSKEIAPLINISVKSVEIKRYRLRKKMNLPRDVNLTDYIIEF